MSVETDLYDTLRNNAGVSALVSTRIYAGPAADNASRPYILYTLVGAERLSTIAGVSDPARYRFQIECVGDTYPSAKSVSNAVISALEGNGYQQVEYDLYDDITERFSTIVDWTFIAD